MPTPVTGSDFQTLTITLTQNWYPSPDSNRDELTLLLRELPLPIWPEGHKLVGSSYWDRTSDPHHVKVLRYHYAKELLFGTLSRIRTETV